MRFLQNRKKSQATEKPSNNLSQVCFSAVPATLRTSSGQSVQRCSFLSVINQLKQVLSHLVLYSCTRTVHAALGEKKKRQQKASEKCNDVRSPLNAEKTPGKKRSREQLGSEAYRPKSLFSPREEKLFFFSFFFLNLLHLVITFITVEPLE